MSASFHAPMASLEELVSGLRDIEDSFDDLKENLAEEVRSLVAEGFEGQRSPSGGAWAPLKMRSGQILRDTGRLQNSFSARPTADGIEVGSNFIGAGVHQHGATIVPKKAKALAIPAVTSFRVFGARGQKLKRARAETTTIFAKRAVIPARPMLPEGADPGPVWGPRLAEVIRDHINKKLGR